jgi:hypothetical protein
VKSGLFTDTTREQNASEIRLNYGYILDAVRRTVPLIRKGGRYSIRWKGWASPGSKTCGRAS